MTLKDQLTTDPNGQGYAALAANGDYSGIMALANKRQFPGRKLVPLDDLEEYLYTNGLWLTWKNAVGTSTAAETFVDYLNSRLQHIDMDNAAVKAGLAQAVIDGLITDAQRIEIDAMADTLVSDAEIGQGRPATLDDIRGVYA